MVVGISPKSFGSHFLSGNEGTGVAMLANDDPAANQELEHVILPGTKDRTSWLIAMETLRKNFGSQYDLKVDYARYRRLQIAYVLGADPSCAPSQPRIATSCWQSSTRTERYGYAPAVRLVAFLLAALPRGIAQRVRSRMRAVINRSPRIESGGQEGYADMLDVYDRVMADPIGL